MKSASGKRPPDKTHNAPEKKLSSRISCAWGIREKGVHTFAPLQSQNFSKKSVWKINNFCENSTKFPKIFAEFWQIIAIFRKKCDFRAVQRSALCRSRRELSDENLLAQFGFDTAESEPCTSTYNYRLRGLQRSIQKPSDRTRSGRAAAAALLGDAGADRAKACAKVCKYCRSWKMLSNAYYLAKFRFDTENEPAKNLQLLQKKKTAI